MTTKRISAAKLFSLSLVFLFNPNVNLIDPLPDLIGYILIIFAIGTAARFIPYLPEFRRAIGFLALISSLRIPAFFMMYNNLSTGRDIVPMFTLIFIAVEAILLYQAVENGSKALCYLSERTDASSIGEPFSIGRSGKTMTLSALKSLTYVFLIARQALNLAPELMLLTSEDIELKRQLREAYPAVLVICILAAGIVGIVWLTCAKGYVKSLTANDQIGSAVKSLEVKGTPEQQQRESNVRGLILALSILVIASLFSFDLTFSDFGEINILPRFIYGVIVFCALFNLTSHKKLRLALSICAASFVLTSIAAQLFTKRFLDRYSYLNLLYSSKARAMYLSVEISSVLETLALLSLLVISAMIFAELIKENTGTHPSDEAYGQIAKKSHSALIKKGCVLFSLPALIGILKCLNVFLKGEVKIISTQISEEGFTSGALPWMSTLIFALCVIYVLYSVYFTHDVKDEIRFKYGIEKNK